MYVREYVTRVTVRVLKVQKVAKSRGSLRFAVTTLPYTNLVCDEKSCACPTHKFVGRSAINPQLSISPFLNIVHPVAGDITKFRLGSHYLPIETGRWSRKPRNERICLNCGVLGDEEHVLYRCTLIPREDVDLENMSELWHQPEIFKLFTRIKDAKFL